MVNNTVGWWCKWCAGIIYREDHENNDGIDELTNNMYCTFQKLFTRPKGAERHDAKRAMQYNALALGCTCRPESCKRFDIVF